MPIQLDSQQLARYQRWEEASNCDLPGRYSMSFQGNTVFAIHDSDNLTAAGNVSIRESNGKLELICGDIERTIEIPTGSFSHEEIKQVLSILDGNISFGEASAQLVSAHTSDELRSLLQALLGCAVHLTDAIQDLEQRIGRTEIVRFPMQSPYLILREYWSNCADVRAAIPDFMTSINTFQGFRSVLADLHIFSTMGHNLDSFYGGSGGIPTIPGGYRDRPVRTGLNRSKAQFINRYLRKIGLRNLLCEERFVYSDKQLLLGRIAEDGYTFRHVPPENGFLDQLIEEARLALIQAASIGNGSENHDILGPLSRFHKLFLHAHPFFNINNSVAMNIVNYHLIRVGLGSIPHLLLDFIALRVDFSEYATVFAKAVEDYSLRGAADEQENAVLARIEQYHTALLSLTET